MKMAENVTSSATLLAAVPNHQTALCPLLVLSVHPPQASPHLVVSEVLYRFSSTAYDEWNLESVGGGTIACGIDQMASSFLAQLTQRESIPHTSMLISYLSITHIVVVWVWGSWMPSLVPSLTLYWPWLKLLDMPSLGSSLMMGALTFTYPLPWAISSAVLSTLIPQHSSSRLRYDTFSTEVSTHCAPRRCADTLDYLENDGSFKSARDRLKQAASSKRRDSLRTMWRLATS